MPDSFNLEQVNAVANRWEGAWTDEDSFLACSFLLYHGWVPMPQAKKKIAQGKKLGIYDSFRCPLDNRARGPRKALKEIIKLLKAKTLSKELINRITQHLNESNTEGALEVVSRLNLVLGGKVNA